MTLDAYQAHMRRLTNSYVRTGVLDSSVDILDPYTATVLGDVEVATRYFNPQKRISDIENGFNSSFLTWFTGQCFLEYLEYKKINQELSLTEWMSNARRQFSEAGYDIDHLADGPTSVSPPESIARPVRDESDLYDASFALLLEQSMQEEESGSHFDDLTLLTNPTGVDSDGYDTWLFEVFDFSNIFPDSAEPYPFAPDQELLSLFTSPEGIDALGFDVWEVDGVAESGGDLLTDPVDQDADGFDVWFAPDDLPTLTGPDLRLLTEPVSSDAEGFDVWTLEKSAYTEPTGVDADGFDTWTDGTLDIVEPTGIDADGYDVWPSPKIDLPPTAEEGVSTYGVDKDGFDVWKKPVSAQTDIIQPSMDASGGVIPSGRPVRRQTRQRTYSFMPVQKTAEDQFVESILGTSKKVKKLGKRVFSLLKG